MPPVDALQALLPPQWLELTLLVSGWMFAFLLGKELGVGYTQWRTKARADQTYRRPPRD